MKHSRPTRITRSNRLSMLMAIIIALFATQPSFAQSASHPSTLRRQISKAFAVNAWEDAAGMIELYLEKVPNDSNMLYNAACAYCRLTQYDRAASYLYKAMKSGFRDLDLLREDPDLEGLRSHPTFKRIFESLEERDESRSYDALSQWRESHKSKAYRYETDRERRIQYSTALDETTHRDMRDMLEAEADHLIDTLFGDPPTYYVLIAIPTPDDSDKFFKGNPGIGGLYQHSRRTLVARNIGGSLRHEFFHAFHYGHMDRLDQIHRLWVQEGMASLYEDYRLNPDGSIEFLPNERHNIVGARARAGRLHKWRDIFSMKSDEFMRRANVLYPQVRSMFRYIAEQGKLVQWYRAYTRNFGSDPSGVRAFETIFDKPLREIERDWRKWLMAQPRLDMTIRNGDAALGIRSGFNLSNDGVVITDVLPNSAAKQAGLRKGDVIVSADDQDTRTMRELQVIIGGKKVGQYIELRVRRDGAYFNVTLRLKALAGGF
ncbi:MAG: PDZ domain-containing protein [Planctomycetota bacterium]|nr:PDZ domain-containing protein [Planctomycetota bacterium]